MCYNAGNEYDVREGLIADIGIKNKNVTVSMSQIPDYTISMLNSSKSATSVNGNNIE